MKLLKKLICLLILILIIFSSVFTLIGYSKYSKALKGKALLTRVSEITSKENYIKYDEMCQNYKNAVVAIEDHRFFSHGAVDFISIARALFFNISNKTFAQGGSTITQQVAKNVILSQERTASRKMAELFGAYDLEKKFSKEEIFELYVNTCYFGSNYYGIYEASMGYYKKAPIDLTLEEAAMLAGIPNAPSVYSPLVNPTLAEQRQKQVLNAMLSYGYIDEI